uniref:F-actin-capping protein subunit beta n=1 Tax=Lactuca sativa TaxID=4236 RepID=A0A9R1XRK6_LACSA|nr:hypothetical protein LSAT_V11C300130310 [Lactuca sativa]
MIFKFHHINTKQVGCLCLDYLAQFLLFEEDNPSETNGNSSLMVLCDVDSAKEFILCDYNRDAHSYRSPWSNKYHPPLDGGMYPSPELRTHEIEENEVLGVYRDQYYEGGTSSVYLWKDDEKEGFLACFLIKKRSVLTVGPEVEGMADYCITSTVMLSMTIDHENSGNFSLSGSMLRLYQVSLPEGSLKPSSLKCLELSDTKSEEMVIAISQD